MSETAGVQTNEPIVPTTVCKFPIAAPHGTRIHASVSGIEIHYPNTMQDAIRKWLESLPDLFSATRAEGQLVPCPKCKGSGVLPSGDTVQLCVLCGGKCRVSKEVAASFSSIVDNL